MSSAKMKGNFWEVKAIGINYSSLSENYDGNYSSQRQELVKKLSEYQAIDTGQPQTNQSMQGAP